MSKWGKSGGTGSENFVIPGVKPMPWMHSEAFSSSRSQTCKSQVRGTYHELNIFAMARVYMNLCDLLAAVTCELIKKI